MSTTLILLGLLGLCAAVVGLLKGSVRTLGLHSRRRSAQAAAGAFVVMMVGGAMAPAPPVETATTAAGSTRTTAPSSPSASPSPSPSPSPTPTPTPSPSATPAASPTPSASASPTPSAPPGTDELIDRAQDRTALALLGRLATKGRGPRTGYAPEQYGQRWADTDRNGCDTRNDVLRRDLTDVTYKAGTRDCVVLSGTRHDPYTGRTLAFTRADASALQIDHVVSLSDAWQTGAAAWPARKRLALANDPLNLTAVDGPTNGSKSDSDAASWLPPHKPGRCPMVARQVAVKAKYGLWVKPAERDAIARVLAGCPGAQAPTSLHPTLAPTTRPRPERTRASQAPAPQPAAPQREAGSGASGGSGSGGGGGTDPDYGTCREANAAGKGPYRQGRDPEYDWYRDQDKDGVVCEP